MHTRTKTVLLGVGLACLLLALAALGWNAYLLFRPFTVTVQNDSSSALTGLTIETYSGYRNRLSEIRPGASITVQPRVGEGEDEVSLVDAQGRVYTLLGYIEGDPGGEVRITVNGVSDSGLTGQVVDRTHYNPAGEFVLEPDRP